MLIGLFPIWTPNYTKTSAPSDCGAGSKSHIFSYSVVNSGCMHIYPIMSKSSIICIRYEYITSMIAVLYNSLCLISKNVDNVCSCHWASGLKAPLWLCLFQSHFSMSHCSIMTFAGSPHCLFFLNSKQSQNHGLPRYCHKITPRIFFFTPCMLLIAKTWSQLSVGWCEIDYKNTSLKFICAFISLFNFFNFSLPF